jgi:hypothetical protein
MPTCQPVCRGRESCFLPALWTKMQKSPAGEGGWIWGSESACAVHDFGRPKPCVSFEKFRFVGPNCPFCTVGSICTGLPPPIAFETSRFVISRLASSLRFGRPAILDFTTVFRAPRRTNPVRFAHVDFQQIEQYSVSGAPL